MDRLWARVERMKHQSPNTKLQRNPKLQIPKPVAGSLPWSFIGVWSLVFGALIGARSFVAGRGRRHCVETAPFVLLSILRTARYSSFGLLSSFGFRHSSLVSSFANNLNPLHAPPIS